MVGALGLSKKSEVAIRRYVRKLLRLPHDISTNYFHAPIKDGGLGIPSLENSVPLIRYKGIMTPSKSASLMIKAASNAKFLVERQR